MVTLGRLNSQKNHKMLIDAVRIVHMSHPEIVLNIYGTGEMETELYSYIVEKKQMSI